MRNPPSSSRMLVGALLLLATALVPTTGTAQTPLDHTMAISVTFKALDVQQLEGGRIGPGDTATYEVTAKVVYPPLSVCLTTVTVQFFASSKQTWATAAVNPSTITQAPEFGSVQPVGNLVAPFGARQDFKTTMTLLADGAVPAHTHAQFDLKAQVTAGTINSGNCNMAPAQAVGTLLLHTDSAGDCDASDGVEAAGLEAASVAPGTPLALLGSASALLAAMGGLYAWRRRRARTL